MLARTCGDDAHDSASTTRPTLSRLRPPLARLAYTRWAMFHQVATTRLTGAAVVTVLLPVAFVVDAESAVGLVAAVVAAVNVVEYRIGARRAVAVAVPDDA